MPTGNNRGRPLQKRLDSAGRPMPSRKATIDEIGRRDRLIAKLTKLGHSQREIATALEMGPSHVSAQLKRMGITPSRDRHVGPITIDCRWRDGDVPESTELEPLPPRWHSSRVIVMAKMLDDEYREGNFANVLAWQVSEAIEAGDHVWVADARETILNALEKLERARRIFTDFHYRDECRLTHEGTEQLRGRPPRTSLRAVQ